MRLSDAYHGSPAGDINVRPILPPVPFHRGRRESSVLVNPAKAAHFFGIRIENTTVCPFDLNPDAVISIALRRMEVEDEDDSGSLEYNDLVTLVLERDECLRGMEPTVSLLALVHVPIKVVEELVTEQVIVSEVQLPPSVPVRVVVPFPGEVQPLGVAKLVAFKVEIPLTPEAVGEQTDHLVQRHAPINDGRERRGRGHVGVKLGITEVHHDALVTHKPNESQHAAQCNRQMGREKLVRNNSLVTYAWS